MADRMEDRSARQRRRMAEEIKAQTEYDAKMARLHQQIAIQTGFAPDNSFTNPSDQINTKLLNYPGADQTGRSIRQSRNAFGKPNMGYENFTPPTVNYGMNAFGQTTKQKTANEKQARFDNATKMATALALQEQNAARTSVTPPGQPPNYQSDRYDYGGPGQGITSRDGPSRNPDVGERLSWFARNSRMPTKEQFDLSLLDPRTRRDAAKVVQYKQKP